MTEEAAHPIVRGSTPARQFDDVGQVAAVAVFPDRRRMATSSSDGMVRVWELKSGVVLMELEGRGAPIRDMALSQDGKMIASSDDEGYVIAWNTDTGKPLTQPFEPNPNSNRICSLDFSPDGTILATGSEYAKVWSTDTWLEAGSFRHSRGVNCVRYSWSGELLALATDHNYIDIWKPAASMHRPIANPYISASAVSLVWTPDSTRLLCGSRTDATIRKWDSSTWKEVGSIWKGLTDYHLWRLAMNRDGTIVASPTADNCVRLWQFSDGRTVAIFRHSDFPCCVTFSADGKHILAGGKDGKISEWPVPEHAWPRDTPEDQFFGPKDCDTDAQDSDTVFQDSDDEAEGFESKILAMNTTVRNACMSGDLTTAEELLTQEIDLNGNNYRSYANRSVIMARKLDWDHALDDATKSLGIQPSLMGYISKGIALFGKKRIRDAKRAFDLASLFTDVDPKTSRYLFLIKSISLFNADQYAEAMRRIRELASACPDADTTLASRVIEVYLHIQLGNNALDRARPSEAADHFTTAVNTGTFLSKPAIDFKYEDLVVLFGCDFNSLWQTANQKRCHALLRAGRLAEVFEAYRYMVDMIDEVTRASCLAWSISFMEELSMFRGQVPNTEPTPDLYLCKSDDENDSISDIDSDIDTVY